MTGLKGMWALVPLVPALALSGCGESAQEQSRMEIRAVVAAAKAEGGRPSDPWGAYQKLTSQVREVLKRNARCHQTGPEGSIVCDVGSGVLPEIEEATLLQFNLLEQAVANSSREAMLKLWGPLAGQRRYDELRRRTTKQMFAYADVATGASPDDAAIWMAAGDAVREGVATIHETDRLVRFYARAWAMGKVQAASRLSSVYAALNDWRNAYLWALRCLEGCHRSKSLESLQAYLTPEAAKQVQSVAIDPTRVALDIAGQPQESTATAHPNTSALSDVQKGE